jgi:two-component system chemotaxis sensor kinase CheA
MGLESARDGFLPLDISLDQLPKRVRVGERHLALEYRPIGETSVLCVVSDVTSDVAREAAEAEQREAMEVFGRILRDRDGVVEFLAEAGEIVRGLTAPARPALAEERRALHTLKGNAALFGLRALSAHCHDLETASAEREGTLTDAERTELSSRWDRTVSQMRRLLGEERGRMITVDEREHADIIDAVLAGVPARSVARRIAAWRMEAAEHRLERIATQAQRLSQTLGKPKVDVQVMPNGVRLAPDRWGRFFSELVHVVRNAVDHGIEPAEERVAQGKEAQGTLTVSTTTENGRLRVVIADDGRGIDWDRVREKADDLGIPTSTHQDLVAALFIDGMTTRSEVTETSGRGVGLASVAEALRDLDGRVDVTTEPQRGTQFRFSMPCPDPGASVSPTARVSQA